MVALLEKVRQGGGGRTAVRSGASFFSSATRYYTSQHYDILQRAVDSFPFTLPRAARAPHALSYIIV